MSAARMAAGRRITCHSCIVPLGGKRLIDFQIIYLDAIPEVFVCARWSGSNVACANRFVGKDGSRLVAATACPKLIRPYRVGYDPS